MVESLLSATATLFNALTQLASYLHIAKRNAVFYRLIRVAPQCHAFTQYIYSSEYFVDGHNTKLTHHEVSSVIATVAAYTVNNNCYVGETFCNSLDFYYNVVISYAVLLLTRMTTTFCIYNGTYKFSWENFHSLQKICKNHESFLLHNFVIYSTTAYISIGKSESLYVAIRMQLYQLAKQLSRDMFIVDC